MLVLAKPGIYSIFVLLIIHLIAALSRVRVFALVTLAHLKAACSNVRAKSNAIQTSFYICRAAAAREFVRLHCQPLNGK